MHYTLPAALTLPIAAIFTAIYNGGRTVVENVVTNPIKQGLNESCNCTVSALSKHRLNIIAGGKEIASRLTELNVHEEDQLKVIKVLNNLEWVQVENVCKDNMYDRAIILLETWFSNFQADKSGYVSYVTVHLLYCFAFHMIINHSIFGILLKIIGYRLKSFLSYPFQSMSILNHAYMTSLRGASSSDLNSEKDSDDGEEFEYCSSTNIAPKIDTEEILARKGQLEEKHGESNENIDKGYESFLQLVQSDQDDDSFPVRKSTPCDKYDNTENIQRSDDIEYTLDSNEGYIGGGDESGDESLLCGY